MEDMDSPRARRRCGSVLRLIAIGCLLSVGVMAAAPQATFDIPAGDASQTLLKFYIQSKVQVLYLADTVRGKTTRAVSGDLVPSQALAQMLEGTGLAFEFEDDFSAMVRTALPGEEAGRAAVAGTVEPPTELKTGAVPLEAEAAPVSKPKEVSEVVVTGSLIRGVMDLMSPSLRVTRKETKQTAYASVQDVMQNLPLNVGAAQSEDFGGTGNFNRGSAINLRGLGPGATLVLVNGRRQPSAGLQADFVDVSNVPWSAVERIEVLPDGSSALYGSDAIAGVVNIIMRDDFAGSETQARVGLAPAGAREEVVAQLFGNKWETGKWVFAYQYSQRSGLDARDRAYAADTDKSALGGTNHSSFRSNPGNILNPQNFQPIFAVPSDQSGTALRQADLLPGTVNWQNTFLDKQLLPDKKMHSAYFSASQEIGQRFEIFGDSRYSHRNVRFRSPAEERLLFVPNTNPFFISPIPGASTVIVAYSFMNDLGPTVGVSSTDNANGSLGLRANLERNWQASLSVSYAMESLRYAGYNFVNNAALNGALADTNPATAFNPFGDGSNTNPETLETLYFIQRNRAVSDLINASFIADGSLFDLRSGEVKLAIGLEHRQERFSRTLLGVPQHYDREIAAGFTELSLPLLGSGSGPVDEPRLHLSLAGRFEQYSDFGNTYNPKIGLRWIPSQLVKLRGSWGKSFKAPKLIDLYDTSQSRSGLLLFPDPLSQIGQSMVLLRQGSNPDLDEETAVTSTIGLDLMSPSFPGLGLSLTGYDIKYENQVIQPGGLSLFDILFQEDRWPGAITRNPGRAEMDAICNSAEYFGSRAQCLQMLPAAIVDIRLRNLATTHVQGLDLKIERSFPSRIGTVDFGIDSNYVFHFNQAFTKTSPATDVIDTAQNPLAFKLRASIGWNQYQTREGGFGARLSIDYAGSYKNPRSRIESHVDSWTKFDVGIDYHTSKGSGWGNNVEASLNAINIFNEDPPFVDQEWGYDYVNADPYGRVVNIYIQKNW